MCVFVAGPDREPPFPGHLPPGNGPLRCTPWTGQPGRRWAAARADDPPVA